MTQSAIRNAQSARMSFCRTWLVAAAFASFSVSLFPQISPAPATANTSASPQQGTEPSKLSDDDSSATSESAGHKVSGLAVIDKILARSPELVLRADGYRLRISPTADLTFRDNLNALSDIQTNIWMNYRGEFDASGDILVSQATFLPARASRFFAVPLLESAPITVDMRHLHKQKRRFSQSDSRFTGIDDQALQERIQRIGMKVVPAYQKALASDDPSKIHFRFIAVDNPHLRGEVCTFQGLVLLPKTITDRLKSDDQLAAVLADGVAANLQRQAARLTSAGRMMLGVGLAGDVAGAFVPGIDLAVFVGSEVAVNRYENALQRQRSRMALALLSDAGYDLQEAPEAWRLLAPATLPADTSALKPPSLSRYLQRLIDRQHRLPSQTSSAASQPPSPSSR